MKIGMIGLGKLGLPVAVAIASRGHQVMGYDLTSARMSKEPQPYVEGGPSGAGEDFNDHLAAAENLSFGQLSDVMAFAEIVFVAVQTPHEAQFEGVTPLREPPRDFDYSYLMEACRNIAPFTRHGQIVAVISTCLPGTMRRDIKPIFDTHPEGDIPILVYTPSFIAMGVTMADYLNPEFWLIGHERKDKTAILPLIDFMESIASRGKHLMSWESAELAKVAYNTAISQKIVMANTIMEICEKIPQADVNAVTGVLKASYRRVASDQYMDGGMGDGGGCHCRDNIAMSWLASELDLSVNIFANVTEAREQQAAWLVHLMLAKGHELAAIIGYAYKPETALTVGSPALLVEHFLKIRFERKGNPVVMWDPLVDDHEVPRLDDHAVLIGCKHRGIEKYLTGDRLRVIDPFRVVPDRDGWTVIRVGEGKT